MRTLFPLPLVALLFASACGNDSRYAASPEAMVVSEQSSSTLAIEHEVTFDVDEEKVEAAHQALLDSCRQNKAGKCTVLASNLSHGEYGAAMLSVRIQPNGIEPLIAVAAGFGELLRRSSQAEDLAKPIQDTGKRVAMLEDYLEDLLRLRQQTRHEVDALIRVAGEIAKTQSELDAAKAEQAQLAQRVDLQVLTIQLLSDRRTSFWSPIGTALEDFSQSLGSGIALTITGLAMLLPWLIVLIPLIYFLRRLWKRFR